MSAYLNLNTMEYPRHIGDIMLDGWNQQDPIPSNWVEIEYVNPPVINNDQKLIVGQPVQNNGIWTHVWEIVPKTEEDYEYERKIAEKNAKIDNGDFVN